MEQSVENPRPETPDSQGYPGQAPGCPAGVPFPEVPKESQGDPNPRLVLSFFHTQAAQGATAQPPILTRKWRWRTVQAGVDSRVAVHYSSFF